jgi:C4-dicarboxylate transporter DctM subunit
MSNELTGIFGALVLFAAILLRVPVAVALGLTGFLGYAAIEGWPRALYVLGSTPFDMAHGYFLSVVPLFVLMGAIAFRSGLSRDLFVAANAMFSGRRGALAMATIGACAGFGAICGSSLATAATMTRVAVPEMRALGYDNRLSTGSVASAGTLAILIPPSVIMVIYAIIAEQSVAKLFAAGLVPGLMLTLFHLVVVWGLVRIHPEWAPTAPALPWSRRLRDLTRMWQMVLLFLLSIGGIYVGWFSPTEAAAVGAFGALVLSFIFGERFGWRTFAESLHEAATTTAMLFFIVIAAVLFSYFLVQTRIPQALVDWVKAMGFAPLTVIIALTVFYVILGCFVDSLGMVLITVPVFFPLVTSLGYDPIWFGILLVVVVEIGLITPPVGMNLFVIQAQQPDVPLWHLYQGILPFLLADTALIVFLLVWPELALWLPRLLYR